jgi:tetratricopeptide (TPR) repeat protein
VNSPQDITSSPPSAAADAFLSHASQQASLAQEIIAGLRQSGLTVWIDDSDVQFGSPLRRNLQQGILGSRCLVLLWSEAALASRWVMMEILTAYHNNRYIVPCVIDATSLPQFLQNVSFLAWPRDQAQMGAKLAQAIRQAPAAHNETPLVMASKTEEVRELETSLAAAQNAEMEALGHRDIDRAAKIHDLVDQTLKTVEPLYPFESSILNLAGYHRKNAYMLKHWDAIQAGRSPPDPLLQESEQRFFDSLRVDPSDPSALNGLGSILMFQREWDEAELLQRRAIHFAGGKYPEAQHDLDLILYYKNKPGPPS